MHAQGIFPQVFLPLLGQCLSVYLEELRKTTKYLFVVSSQMVYIGIWDQTKCELEVKTCFLLLFYVHVTYIVINCFIIKPTRCTNFPNLLRHETLYVSGSSSAHHQEFIHCTLSNGICHTGLKTAFEQDQDGTPVPSWSCSKAVFKPAWHIPLLSVQWMNSWWRAEELPETCRVSCRSKFGKLVRIFCCWYNRYILSYLICWNECQVVSLSHHTHSVVPHS